MRTPLIRSLVTLGILSLAGAEPGAHAGVAGMPAAAIVVPSQDMAKPKRPQGAPQQAKKPVGRKGLARKSAHRDSIQLAALGTPDLSLLPATILTEKEALKSLEQDLSLKVGKHIHASDYPDEARRWHWTGTTLVQVQVGTDGMVRDVEIERSSGFRVLDEQALTVVRRVSRVFVPFRLRGREHAVVVPIGFYLKEI